jgi:hypothetical protein
MKQLISTAALILIGHCGYSQFYLGYSLNEVTEQVRKEVGMSINIFKVENNDGTFFITWRAYGRSEEVAFNSNNLSTDYYEIPDDLPTLNSQIEVFNKGCVKISDTEWTDYFDNGKIFKITLDRKDSKYEFHYSRIQ